MQSVLTTPPDLALNSGGGKVLRLDRLKVLLSFNTIAKVNELGLEKKRQKNYTLRFVLDISQWDKEVTERQKRIANQNKTNRNWKSDKAKRETLARQAKGPKKTQQDKNNKSQSLNKS